MIANGILQIADRRDASIIRANAREPFLGRRFAEFGGERGFDFSLARFRGKLIRDQILATERVTKITPEFRLESAHGEV